MGIHGIIGDNLVLFYKVQVRFAYFEEDLYVPAFPINADDFFFGKLRIRAYNYQPVLAFAFIADIHKFCRDAFAVFFNRHRISLHKEGSYPP